MKKFIIAVLMMAPMSLMAQTKFAHFSSQDVMENMKEYTTAKTELETMQKQYEADIKLMQDEAQKKYEDYQKESANLLENVRQRREQELNDLAQRIQQSAEDNQKALQKAYQEKIGAISEKILNAVKKIGEAGGYVYIFDSSTQVVPFINSALSTDVTAQVKKEVGIVQ